MNKWRLKCKKWKDKHSRKIIVQKPHVSYYSKEESIIKNVVISKHNNVKKIIKVPNVFSFINNTEETMSFFEEFITIIECSAPCTHLYIDSKDVEFVTVDALIYLLAAMDNMVRYKKYSYSGSFPNNKEARKVYMDSGFTKFVTTPKVLNKRLPRSTDKMRINRGLYNDPRIAGEICDFVRKALGFNYKNSTSELYKVLIELFSNAYWHAFDLSENMKIKSKWYIYAEHLDGYVQIVFADTGKGIPETVRKRISEKILIYVNEFINNGIRNNDSELIKSALNGEFRTQTKEVYRGNGLNTVREQAMKRKFKSFDIISSHGRCSFKQHDNDFVKEIFAQDYKHKIYGTLYVFSVCRGDNNDKDKNM